MFYDLVGVGIRCMIFWLLKSKVTLQNSICDQNKVTIAHGRLNAHVFVSRCGDQRCAPFLGGVVLGAENGPWGSFTDTTCERWLRFSFHAKGMR